MNLIELFMLMNVAIILIAIIIGWGIGRMAKRIKELKRPKAKIIFDVEKLKKLKHDFETLDFESKLKMLEYQLGSYSAIVTVEDGCTMIETLDHIRPKLKDQDKPG